MSREHDITIASWTATYRFCVLKHDEVGPDEIEHGGVPSLQYSQARRDLRRFEMSYNNEQREYCTTTA